MKTLSTLTLLLALTFSSYSQWMHVDLPSTLHNFYNDFADDSIGFVYNEHADIYRTLDGGQNWAWIHPDHNIYNFKFLSATSGFAISDSGIYHSVDTGMTWNLAWSSIGIVNTGFIASQISFSGDHKNGYVFYFDAYANNIKMKFI